MITKKQVEYIANLARIGLTNQEKEKFAKDLANILKYVEKLNELNLKDAKPTSHVINLINITRDDNFVCNLTSEQKIKLLKSAPYLKDAYIKVKEIFKNHKN